MAVHAVFALMLTLGYRSRVASLGAWATLVSIQTDTDKQTNLDIIEQENELTAATSFSSPSAPPPCRPYSWSLYYLDESWLYATALMAVHAVFALMLTLGYRSRVASLGAWIMLVSIQNRAPPVLDGGDYLLMNLMFWGTFFLPWRYVCVRARIQGFVPVLAQSCACLLAFRLECTSPLFTSCSARLHNRATERGRSQQWRAPP